MFIKIHIRMSILKELNFKLTAVTISLMLTFPFAAIAGRHFDPAMLSSDGQEVADLSMFEKGNIQLPGEYQVDIYLNGNKVITRTLRFLSVQDVNENHKEPQKENNQSSTMSDQQEIHDSTGLIAFLTKKDLIEMGVNIAGIAALSDVPEDQLISPGKYIPQSYTAFDFQKMRLDISIPQAALKNQAPGWIDQKLWDEGINAALLNYQFSGSDNRGTYGDSRNHFLNLTSGLNFGPWRLRDNSTWTESENHYGHQQRWQRLNTYVQRAVIPLRSEFTAGDSTTSGDVFDAFSFRGAQVATDDSMYPDTMRGFAPEIQGTANSNAKISISQNGHVIYQTFVAAGAFKINDLNPVSSGGDLEVSVTEADGKTRVFTVPYSSVPLLQRQGHLRYGITAGRYRSANDQYTSPSFAQGTLLWGLPHNITAYGGLQMADRYHALALGAGVNMGLWGAISADVTEANSKLADGSKHNGQSIRFLYGRSLIATGTTIQLAGYRYSTQGFHTFEETALKNMSGWINDPQNVDAAGRPAERNWNNYYNMYSNKRERIQANLSQKMGHLGALYLTGSRQTYWRNSNVNNSLQVGFSSSVGHVNYNMAYGYTRVSNQPHADKTLSFSIIIPLESWSPQRDSSTHHPIWTTYSAIRNSDNQIAHQMSLSGTALSADNLNWNVSQGYGQLNGGSGDAGLAYQSSYGNASVGYGYSQNYHQIRYGASGGVLVHKDGVTLGQPLGDTNVLVAVKGIAGIPVENGNGIRTDWHGFAVVPYASTYRENRIALNVDQLDDHTDLEDASVRVVPTKGALVRARFKSHSGMRVLMTIIYNGQPLPFGTPVSAINIDSNGLTGDEGQVYLSGLPQSGELIAKWGNEVKQQCTVHYRLPESSLHESVAQVHEICR